jgi:hypothetical protein
MAASPSQSFRSTSSKSVSELALKTTISGYVACGRRFTNAPMIRW